MDCPICKCDLGFPDFVASSEDHEESEQVFRLKCGHAFHNACLCRALRTDHGCPMCRGTLEETAADGITNMQIVVDADGLLTLQTVQTEPDVAETTFDLAEARRVNEALTAVGSVTSVQKARFKVNKATRKYRLLEHSLFKERATTLRKALDDFRDKHRNVFDKERRNLKRTLRSLRHIETAEVAKVLNDVDLSSYINYEVGAHVGNNETFGPLKHSFWKH